MENSPANSWSRRRFLAAGLAGPALYRAAARAATDSRPPNIIFMMADNESSWMLGCYGNRDFRTPHLDRLAAEGTMFTRAMSSNPVCSPTRATYLTGLLPSQHGLLDVVDAKYIHGEKESEGSRPYEALSEFRTLPKILSEEGYTCGLVGKWHLGNSLHPASGYSSWVTMPKGNADTFFDAEVVENGKIQRAPGYLTDYWATHAVKFLEENKDRPFLLHLAFNGPYSVDPLMLEPARNRHAAYYSDKELLCCPRDAMHPWLFDNKAALNNIAAIRKLASEVSGVDDAVGRVMAELRRLGLDDNTLIVYCADQGSMAGQNGIWGMGDHTRPLGAFDPMINVPLIFRQPGRIPAGAKRDIIVSNYDFFPTVLSYLGLASRVPASPVSPGRDYSSFLQGGAGAWDNVMHYEMGASRGLAIRAIRADRWKFVARLEGPFELYDMKSDPNERFNLFGQPNLAGVQKEMAGRLAAFFDRYSNPQYDIWRGGAPKACVIDRASRGPGA